MIQEDYVIFETAKLLKEKGFDVWGDGSFGTATKIWKEYSPNGRLNDCSTSSPNRKAFPAPTHQMALKWLRKAHNIAISPYALSLGWYFEIFDLTKRDITGCKPLYKVGIPSKITVLNSYEEAVEAALKYALENLI